MNLVLKVRLIICLSIALLAIPAQTQSGPLKDQIAQHEQKLATARVAGIVKEETTELNILGFLYRQAGKMQKALDYLNEALAIEQNTGSQAGQALTEITMGRVYTDMGQEDKAMALFNQALAVWRKLGIRQAEATTLNSMGRAYNNLGQREEALKYLNDALAIWREVNKSQGNRRMMSTRDRLRNLGQLKDLKEQRDAMPEKWREESGPAGEASTLDNLGRTYSDMGQGMQALDYFNQALPLWRATGEHGGEALTLNNIGRTYADLGMKQKSLESYNQALAIWREVGNRQGEASTLNNIGRFYRDLGLQQSALDYYNQALPVWREVESRSGEALALNDIGRTYADTHQAQKALDYYNQALPIWRETGNRRGEAATLNNMGRAYSVLGEADKALEYDIKALTIWREVEDRRGQAMALMTIGWAYSAQKEPLEALVSEMAALSLTKAAGDPEIEGGVETSLMMGFRKRHRPEEAIFFGMEAVNSYQQLRRNISGLDKELQAGFAQSKSSTYRILAELLVQADRLGEAEQILDLLKEQELNDIVRGATPDAGAKIEPLKLTAAQQKAESDLAIPEKMAVALTEQCMEYEGLHANATRTAAEDARMKTLSAGIEQGIRELLAFFTNTIDPELEQKPDAGKENGSPTGDNSTQSYLQNTLAKLGPRVTGIRLLLGEDHAYVILVTANTRKKVVLNVMPAELRSKALETLESLGSRSADPRPHLEELYAMIVAPIEDELKPLEAASAGQSVAPTLLWSLDDALRYLPMAALYDGRQYMVERFNNVLFTPESYGHMTDSLLMSETNPNVLAMGLSKSYGGLPALPGVLPELDSVVRDPAVPDSHGPLVGRLLPNDQFTLAALKQELGAGKGFAVVHIASHFVVETGSGAEPYLMMGGEDAGDAKGFAWDLSDMENSPVAFHGTRLLTLSACSTAKDYKSRDGLEMDSLGMIAQQKDAEAVLATLWDVNDSSTSRLMSDFYDRWVKHPADGKAEALRQAQLALLRGTATTPGANGERGIETIQNSTTAAYDAGYSHPFYWAPFVLIGNYQ